MRRLYDIGVATAASGQFWRKTPIPGPDAAERVGDAGDGWRGPAPAPTTRGREAASPTAGLTLKRRLTKLGLNVPSVGLTLSTTWTQMMAKLHGAVIGGESGADDRHDLGAGGRRAV